MILTHRRLASAPKVRDSTDADASPGDKLGGYAAMFRVPSQVLFDATIYRDKDGNPLPFVEVLDTAVFDRTLREMPDVRALYNHNTDALLGRTMSGTLRISTDADGLLFEDDLPDTVDGQRARVLVGRGDIDGCSFGFGIVDDSLEERDGQPALHTIFDVDLYEISIAVTFPAYLQTTVSVRTRTRGMKPPITTPRLDHYRRRLKVLGS
jgi:HK97 family phage prohead protease